MVEKRITEAINWETLLTATNNKKDLVQNIWNEYPQKVKQPLLMDFSFFADKIGMDTSELCNIFLKVRTCFSSLPENTIVLSAEDEAWPSKINSFPYCPKFLYCQGNIDLLKKKIAVIVGSKAFSDDGIVSLKKTVDALVKNEIIITTGLSLGIEGYASAESISHFAPTIAVIGTSLNHYYPEGHKKMQRFIAEQGGLVVTHCPPCDQNFKWNFLLRNRLMSALSDAIVIIEERDNGNGVMLAEFAAENGKEVYFYASQSKKTELKWPKMLKSKDNVYAVRFPGNLINKILKIKKVKKESKKMENPNNQLSLF